MFSQKFAALQLSTLQHNRPITDLSERSNFLMYRRSAYGLAGSPTTTNCESARGPNVDRRSNLLRPQVLLGLKVGAYSQTDEREAHTTPAKRFDVRGVPRA